MGYSSVQVCKLKVKRCVCVCVCKRRDGIARFMNHESHIHPYFTLIYLYIALHIASHIRWHRHRHTTNERRTRIPFVSRAERQFFHTRVPVFAFARQNKISQPKRIKQYAKPKYKVREMKWDAMHEKRAEYIIIFIAVCSRAKELGNAIPRMKIYITFLFLSRHV